MSCKDEKCNCSDEVVEAPITTIKELFNPYNILNYFEEIEFESFKIFTDIWYGNFLALKNKKLIIPINTLEEKELMYKLFDKTHIEKQNRIFLKFSDEILQYQFGNYSHSLLLDYEQEFSIFDRIEDREFISKNPIYKRVRLNKDNYAEMINGIVSCMNQTGVRHYELKFDYESFEDMPLGELHKLKFWLFHLRNWFRIQADPLIVDRATFRKHIFVDNEMNLRLGDEWVFSLKEHIDDNGETLDIHTLNHLRSYLDLKEEYMTSEYQIQNWALVDFEQNIKIQGYLNEIPTITELINRWLYA